MHRLYSILLYMMDLTLLIAADEIAVLQSLLEVVPRQTMRIESLSSTRHIVEALLEWNLN